MKRTLLFIACLLASLTMLAQDELAVEDIQNSGCLAQTRGGVPDPLPTIVLMKEGNILSVQLLNYESNCATVDFEVDSRMLGGNDDTPSVTASVVPVIPVEMDCTCPFNISFTVRGLEKNKFNLTCWWFDREVELTEGEPLVLEFKTEDVVIDGLKFTLLKTTHQAKLLFQNTLDDKAEILQIPSEVEYEGVKYIVTSINQSVFASNTVIKQITIPKTIKNTNFGSMNGITSNLFSGCLSLETIEVDEENPAMCSLDGVLFNKNKTTLISYPAASPRESYNVPDNVIKAARGAFFSSQHLKKIVLPDKMETLGVNLFGNSNSLEEVILPSNIKELPVYLFKDCKKLKSVDMPKDLTTIRYSAFEGCSSLESISLPKSVVTVDFAAFMDCTSLKSVILSPNLKELPQSMFKGCSNLSEVTIPLGVTSIGNGVFVSCEAMQSFDLPESINSIDGFAFGQLPNLKDIYCHSTTVPNTNKNAFYGTDLSQATLHVPAASVSAYQATEPWKSFTEIVALTAQENDTNDSDYIPFVEAGKQWHVVISYAYENINASPYYGGSHSKYRMYEEVERNGKTYLHAARILIAECENQDAGLYREENRRVFKYDEATGRDIMLYDFSLKEGDTFTYEFGLDQPVNCKVLKQGLLTEGPKIATSSTIVADTLETRYRWLRTWTIGRDNGAGGYDEFATWVECIGALENVFGLIDNGLMKFDSNLAYVERTDHETGYGKNEYLPFSFYTLSMHGSNLPIGAEDYSGDWHHQLTYELEGNRLHVYGKVFTQCGPNNYAYFTEEPTDDPLLHEIHFQTQEVEPLADCMALHATNFYVPGFDPNMNYIVVDNYGEEHPVINKTPQMAYRPMIEEGKVWKVGALNSGNPAQWVEYYYFDGDTIIDGKTCKQMMSQRYVNPVYAESNYISQDNALSYVGAWYEEDQKVYEYDTTSNQFKLMYDFSANAYDTLLIDNGPYVIGPKQTGGIRGFKGVYRAVFPCSGVDSNRSDFWFARWLEGVGGINGPMTNVIDGQLADPAWFLMSCTVGDEVIYLNDEFEDGATPETSNAPKSRFDFTHIVKDKPKAPKRRGAEQSLYGEYTDMQLAINLDPLDEAYLVRITNEAGKVVYEKAINAGNIVALNIDISAYPKGRYSITVENSHESFTGQFDTKATGIVEVKSKKVEPRDGIYNLQGQRISYLQKGLNIVNGRKVMVK